MKLLGRLLLVSVVILLAATRLTAAPASVAKWGLFELELKGPAEGNPFRDVRFSAIFTEGNTTVEVPGFYDGEGVYKVRFSPSTTGKTSFLSVTPSHNSRRKKPPAPGSFQNATGAAHF